MNINEKEKKLLDEFMEWFLYNVDYWRMLGSLINNIDLWDGCNFIDFIGCYVRDEIICKDISEFMDLEDDDLQVELLWNGLKKKVSGDYLWEEYHEIMQELRDNFINEYSN